MPNANKVNCNCIVRNKKNEVDFMTWYIYSKLYYGHKIIIKIASHINGLGICVQLTQNVFLFSVTRKISRDICVEEPYDHSWHIFHHIPKSFQKVLAPSSMDHESENNFSSEMEEEIRSFEYDDHCLPLVIFILHGGSCLTFS